MELNANDVLIALDDDTLEQAGGAVDGFRGQAEGVGDGVACIRARLTLL